MSPWFHLAGLAVVRVLVSLVVLAGLGHLLILGAGRLRGSASPRNPFARAFTFLSVGVAVFVTVQALVVTGGRTVLCCMLVAFVGLFAFRDVEAQDQPAPEVPHPRPGVFVVASLGFVVLILWSGIQLFRGGSFPYQLHAEGGTGDAAYWAAAADALPISHLESGAAFEAVLDRQEFFPEPYHYVELWLTAGLSRIWSVPTYGVLFFDVPVILGMTWLFGFLAVGEALGITGWRTTVSGLLLLSYAPLTIARPAVSWLNGWAVLELEGPFLGRVSAGRLFPGCIVIAAAVLLALKRRPRRALAILALAPATNPTLLALPLGGIISFLVLARGEYAEPRRFLRVVLPCAVIVATFWSFYAVHSRMLPPELLPDLLDPGLLRTKLNIIGKSVLQTAFVYGPYVVLAVAGSTALVRRGVLVAAIVTGTGLLGWVATHPFIDAHQFWLNATLVAFNSLFAFAVLAPRPALARTCILAVVAIIAIVRWQWALARGHEPFPYSDAYLEAVQHAPAGRGGAFLVPDDILHSGNPHALYLRTSLVPYLQPMGHFPGAVAIVDVLPFAPWPAMRYRYEDLLFRRFLSRYGIPSQPQVSACLQEAFVDHYDLEFVVLVGTAVKPSWLKRREVRQIADPISGDRFVLVDRSRRGRPPETCAAAPP